MNVNTPFISVITPVGPRHHDHVRVAAASVRWQTLPSAWVEHIVEHDTDRSGPAAVRNRALTKARGTFIVALDADDYLIPTALETYLRGYAAADACYVYADNYVINEAGWSYSNSQEYDQRKMARYNQHVVTALYPTALAREVGGWDEGIDIWEDWSLPLRCAIRGWCGHRLAQPALVYRVLEGERMARGMSGGVELMEAVWKRYANEAGAIEMCGCNKPAHAALAQQAATFAVQVLGGTEVAANGQTRLEYQGLQGGKFYVTSPQTKRQYAMGGRRLIDADPADVDWLISLGCAPVVRAEFAPPPEPAAIAEGTETESVAVGAAEPAPLPFEVVPGPTPPVDGEAYQPKTLKRKAG